MRDEQVININSATADELDVVPCLRGHGFEIVRHREERGRFSALRQLDEVPGLAGKVSPDETRLTAE
jgi:competence protein ComEA